MESDEKKIEAFIEKLMSADTLEQPSVDFTDMVMSKVEAVANSQATVYKPLIPKAVWFLIIGGFIALVGCLTTNESEVNSSWLNRFDWSKVSLNLFENVSSNLSSTLMYAVVLLAIMISIQVPLLKYYFNKRMTF
jgi:hypothetical protein